MSKETNKFVFLDLNTTGREEKDSICELSFIIQENSKRTVFDSLCKPKKKVAVSAMAIHNITNEMLKKSVSCEKNKSFEALKSINKNDTILISHNLLFNLQMLEKEELDIDMQSVDTMRCVKALIPECERFDLQFLRYELQLYKNELKEAKKLDIVLKQHSALFNAFFTQLLWQTLLQYATVSELIEISIKPILLEKLFFGKYIGRYIEEIASIDPSYLQWILTLDRVDEDLAYSIKYYMKG